jgi:hypothetical protein
MRVHKRAFLALRIAIPLAVATTAAPARNQDVAVVDATLHFIIDRPDKADIEATCDDIPGLKCLFPVTASPDATSASDAELALFDVAPSESHYETDRRLSDVIWNLGIPVDVSTELDVTQFTGLSPPSGIVPAKFYVTAIFRKPATTGDWLEAELRPHIYKWSPPDRRGNSPDREYWDAFWCDQLCLKIVSDIRADLAKSLLISAWSELPARYEALRQRERRSHQALVEGRSRLAKRPKAKRGEAEKQIRRLRAVESQAQAAIDEERKIGEVSGSINRARLHEAGLVIVRSREAIERQFAIYKSNGGPASSVDDLLKNPQPQD